MGPNFVGRNLVYSGCFASKVKDYKLVHKFPCVHKFSSATISSCSDLVNKVISTNSYNVFELGQKHNDGTAANNNVYVP